MTLTLFTDDVVHLRQWGTSRLFALPAESECYIGSAESCALRLTGAHVAPLHARFIRHHNVSSLAAVAGVVALRQDGHLCRELALSPGVEVGIGTMTLIAESERWIALRAFCARLLGWGADRAAAIDYALRAVRLAASRRLPLVLTGNGDMVSIAHALHRRTLGTDAPFVVCDRRRRTGSASTRAPANQVDPTAAFGAAVDGTLCMRARRLPSGLTEIVEQLYEPAGRVQLVVCMDNSHGSSAITAIMPPPVEVPPLAVRGIELPRIIDEYAIDALAAIGAPNGAFTDKDRCWVLQRSAHTLDEVEKATLRLVALNASNSLEQAAERLAMAPVSLSRWFRHRGRIPYQAPTPSTGSSRPSRRRQQAMAPELEQAARRGPALSSFEPGDQH